MSTSRNCQEQKWNLKLFFSALPVLSSRVIVALYSISLRISEAFLITNSPDRDTHIGILYTGQEKTFHLGLLCIAFLMLGLSNSLRLNGIKSLRWQLHARLSRCGFRAVLVDSCSFKISNFASWNCQLFYPYVSSGRDFVLCIFEFGVAAFFFEMSSQLQRLTGLQPYLLQRFYC